MTRQDDIPGRLEDLRASLRAENISYGELAELQELAGDIDPGDTELLEAASVPEFPDVRAGIDAITALRKRLYARKGGRDNG